MRMLVGYLGKTLCGAAVVAAFMVLPAGAATEIGKTVVVVKTVTGQVEQNVRQLVINDGVSQNEVIATEPDAASEIVFLDGTKISVGPRARITLDKFVYDPNPTKGTFFLTATEGVFRFVTGNMAHQSYKIATPNGTIGVRGTTLDIMVCSKLQPPTDPTASTDCTVVKVEQGDAFFRDLNGVETPISQGQTRTIFGPGQSGNSATVETGFSSAVTQMDNLITIGQLAALSPEAGGRGNGPPLSVDPTGTQFRFNSSNTSPPQQALNANPCVTPVRPPSPPGPGGAC
jgi:hypothetical protein